MSIETNSGENVRTIGKIYLDLEGGEVIGVVVSTGGFLGVGVHHNILVLNELPHNAGEDKILVELNREQLRSAPTYKENDSSWHATVRERSERNAALRTNTRTTARTAERDSNRPTAFCQGNRSAETRMTADIRSAIRENDNMSTRANNVTIFTQQEKVLLRGNVDPESEKTAIENINPLTRGYAHCRRPQQRECIRWSSLYWREAWYYSDSVG